MVVISLIFVVVLSISFFALSSSPVTADTTTSATAAVIVSAACNISSTVDKPHSATIPAGMYKTEIGTTTFKVLCNDTAGFSVYTIGYSNEEYGNTKLLATIGGNLDSTHDVVTGTATSGSTSNWAMKLNSVAGTYAPTIVNDFNDYHVVPETYTKAATLTSNTDSTTGSSFQATYAAYITGSQPAGYYDGIVKYTIVHPNNADAPISRPAILDTGRTVNSKLKSLAATVANGTETTITPEFNPNGDYDLGNAYDEYVKSVVVHLETPAPSGFTPTSANTISIPTSREPVYIVFDNTNDAGIMHFYTEGEQIVLSSDSSFMFYMLNNLTTISGISNWDTSNVTVMSYMFYNAGYSAATFSLDLSSWDTSSVTDMSYMFASAGYAVTTWSVGDLSSWDTSNVTDMSNMFNFAGYAVTTWSVGDLSSWDTSSVTDMSYMFHYAGYSATTWSIGNLSSWDTSSVTNMTYMFSHAGYSATTFTLNLSSWDTSGVTDMSYMFLHTGFHATTWSIGNLSSWDTSSVTKMNSMFSEAGRSATIWSIGDLSSWETSSVTNMASMFRYAGSFATTWSIGDLSSWETSSVTNMSYMFYYAGYSATTFSLDLSSWDTSSVTNMSNMFSYAGRSATTWSITIPQTNGNNISNTTSRLYGKTTSVYATPLSGKSFTLAQP